MRKRALPLAGSQSTTFAANDLNPFGSLFLGEHEPDTGHAEELSLARRLGLRERVLRQVAASHERGHAPPLASNSPHERSPDPSSSPAPSSGGTLARLIWVPAGRSGTLGPNGMSSGAVRFWRGTPSNPWRFRLRRLSCRGRQASIASTTLRDHLPSPSCVAGGSGSSELPTGARTGSRLTGRGGCHRGCVDSG